MCVFFSNCHVSLTFFAPSLLCRFYVPQNENKLNYILLLLQAAAQRQLYTSFQEMKKTKFGATQKQSYSSSNAIKKNCLCYRIMKNDFIH